MIAISVELFPRLLLTVAVAMLSACVGRDDKQSIAVSQARDITQRVIAYGVVEPSRFTDVKAEASGMIAKRFVETGQQVRQGDLLFEIESKQTELELQLARLAMEEAELEINGLNMREKRDDHVTALAILETRLERRKLELAEAHRQMRLTQVRAPIDGTVSAINVSEGKTVSSGTLLSPASILADISDTGRYIVKLSLNEVDVAKVRVGQEVAVRLDAIVGLRASGRIKVIDGVSRQAGQGGKFPVTVEFHTVASAIRSGMSASVTIDTETVRQAVSVPLTAIHYVHGMPSVLVDVKGRGIEERKVEIGISDFQFIEIKAGLTNGVAVLVGERSG